VHGVISGVEVEDPMLRRLIRRSDELIDPDFGDWDQGLALDAVLQATEGRGRSQGKLTVGEATGGQLEGGVAPQGLVVVEVLGAQGHGHDPLGDQGSLIVDDKDRVGGSGMTASMASKRPVL
jgi:hypothetical protein